MNPLLDHLLAGPLLHQSQLIEEVVHALVLLLQLVVAALGDLVEAQHALHTAAVLPVDPLHAVQQQIGHLAGQLGQTLAGEPSNAALKLVDLSMKRRAIKY